MRGYPALAAREIEAVDRLLARVLARPELGTDQVSLFGSRARRAHDRASDLDLLFLCRVPPRHRDEAARAIEAEAAAVAGRTHVPIETWTVTTRELRRGRRTPMLVDACRDAIPLWPPGAPPLRLRFTPADAVFCADRLLRWVEEGGGAVQTALEQGRAQDAARRSRDDIARMATAALLLTGDTRHRGAGSLARFEVVFVAPRLVSAAVLPALAWAASAYPDENRRGPRAPASEEAVRTASRGYALAGIMETHTVPMLLQRTADLRRHDVRRRCSPLFR